MVAFIGTMVGRTTDQYRIPTVTFAVREWLWGSVPSGTAVVRFSDGFSADTGEQLLLVTPRGDGTYGSHVCGGGVQLPARHELAQEIIRWIRQRHAARISVEALSSRYVPIYDAEVELTGSGGTFRAGGGLISTLRSWNESFDLLKHIEDRIEIPPGEYRVSSRTAKYKVPEPNRSVSILPGSCASLRIPLIPKSSISGRVVTAKGEPVGNARFILTGMARSGRRNIKTFDVAKTDRDGKFTFSGVMSGWYYIEPDVEGTYEAYGLSLPKLFYPGVPSWLHAEQLIVEERKSIDSIEYRLPDLGKPVGVSLKLVTEDGVPVVGAEVRSRGSDFRKDNWANLEGSAISDRNGRVNIKVWPTCEYEIMATLYSASGWKQAEPVRISRGVPSQPIVVLRALSPSRH
jgi:hypothetical protein